MGLYEGREVGGGGRKEEEERAVYTENVSQRIQLAIKTSSSPHITFFPIYLPLLLLSAFWLS